MYNLHTLLYMKKGFDILMEIFCLACTYIVQTYNYSRVKKVHEHIPHMHAIIMGAIVYGLIVKFTQVC